MTRGGEQRTRRPPPGSMSALIDELARAPERDLHEAWERGPRPGDVVGRFELVRELGRGGFGIVFEARDLELGRRVAFKAIRPGRGRRSPAHEELLRREAEAVARLQHPNIVTLHDLGRCASGPYLVLELLRGETLATRIARGPMPLAAAVRVAVEIARALVHAHAHGILHRDLKPGNVFLLGEGGVKVLDFGLAHVFGAGRPAGSGTPGYMAPEQIRGEVEDARTDLFALGVLVHETLTGRRLTLPTLDTALAAPLREAPPLAAEAAPPALARLVARMLESDPARRPRDAAEVLRALRAVERALSTGGARGRRVATAAAILASAVVSGSAAYAWLRPRPPARAAVADVENEPGDPLLDGIAGMLETSIGEARPLVSRRRLLAVAAAGAGRVPPRLEGDVALESARRTGVDVLLLPRVQRAGGAGGALEIAVRAVEPRRGRERFSVTGRTDTATGIPELVDELARQIRLRWGEREAAVQGRRLRVERVLTPDLEAYRHYFAGQACAARPVVGQDCGAEFRKAIARDPRFALAYYELAVWSYWNGGSRAEQRAAIARAAALGDGLPAREEVLIRAWRAYLEGQLEASRALYEEVTRRWPDDPHAWMQLADILRRRARGGAAVAALERAASADPDSPWALGYLAECLGASGQRERLRERVRAWERAPRLATLHALSIAYGWLGELPRAVSAAEREVALGGGLLAQEDRLAALVSAGAYAAGEPLLEALAAPQSEVRPLGYYGLAALDAYRGRRRAGLAALDALRREVPAIEGDGLYHTLRVDYLLGGAPPGEVRRGIEALRAVDPGGAAEHAPGLAWLGERELARELAGTLRRGSPYADAYEAVAAWRGGDAEGALSRLRALSRETPCATWRVPPVYLTAEVAAASGHDDVAVEAVARFHEMYLPLTMWRSWAYPRSLVLLAGAQARLGQPGRARATLDRFFVLWGSADPEAPLLAEARRVLASLPAQARGR